jgi:GT2 family glycosyltransferase
VPDAVVAYVRGRYVDGEFCESLLALGMGSRTRIREVIALKSGPNISAPRNLIVRRFLDAAHKAPWLLMVDTDMVFAADALDRLIAAAHPSERPLLGALCYGQNDGAADPYPTMYELTDTQPVAFSRLASWPEDTPVRVSATGCGFLLMHRTALERIEASSGDAAAPWFRESAIGAPLALLAEDLTFCLRAGMAAVPVHVHTGVGVGHMKPVMLGKVT